jgi:hypothetical protein
MSRIGVRFGLPPEASSSDMAAYSPASAIALDTCKSLFFQTNFGLRQEKPSKRNTNQR